MNNKLFKLLFAAAMLSLPFRSWSQNYVGYSKEYIKKAIAAEYKDLKAPVEVKNEEDNYLIFAKNDDSRIVMYHFQVMPVTLDNGKQTQAEICIKYYSKNKCNGNFDCPQMDEVVSTLDNHFEKGGTYLQWIDDSRRTPQEWMLVRDNDYFEVHVMELKK